VADTRATDTESMEVSVLTRALIEAAKVVCNASFDELAAGIVDLRAAGEKLELRIADLYAEHGLFDPFYPNSNVVIFDERARALAEKNHEAQRAADTSTAQHN
jgi:hypothetical protein